MYETPKMNPVKQYQTPVLVDVKQIAAYSVCITGGGKAQQTA